MAKLDPVKVKWVVGEMKKGGPERLDRGPDGGPAAPRAADPRPVPRDGGGARAGRAGQDEE